MLEEEVEARVTSLVEARVREVLGSAAVQETLQQRLEQERALLEQQVEALLEEEARERTARALRAAEAIEAKRLEQERARAAAAAAAEAARREAEAAAQAEAEARLRELQQRTAQQQYVTRGGCAVHLLCLRSQAAKRPDKSRAKLSFKLG